MVALSQIIQFLHPSAQSLLDFVVSDDGDGAYISMWDADKLGPQPTLDELEKHRTDAEAFYNAPDMRDQLDQMWAAMAAALPIAERAQLRLIKIAVVDAMNAGAYDEAAALIAAQTVPAEFIEIQNQAVAMLQNHV